MFCSHEVMYVVAVYPDPNEIIFNFHYAVVAKENNYVQSF